MGEQVVDGQRVDTVTGEVIEPLAAPPDLPPGRNIAAKLLAVMEAIGTVEKDGTNTFHRYKYASDSAIFKAVRAALHANRVFCGSTTIQREDREVVSRDGSREKTQQVCKLLIRTTFVDTDSGEAWSTETWGDGSDVLDKASYKALTGALKYGLKAAFLISTEDGDPDADDRGHDRRDDRGDRGRQGPPRDDRRPPQQQRPDQRQQQRPDARAGGAAPPAATPPPTARPPANAPAPAPAAPPTGEVFCECPCGCANPLSAQLAAYAQEHLGSHRCRDCYPAAGFRYEQHRGLTDLGFPKYPDGYAPERAKELAERAPQGGR